MEVTMRKLLIALSASTALIGGAMISGLPATAAPGSILGIPAVTEGLVQKAAYVFEGRRHCWYARGWHGPGWYWCGYGSRKGRGWGGEEGWNGWRH
jgi:hypothetical protein